MVTSTTVLKAQITAQIRMVFFHCSYMQFKTSSLLDFFCQINCEFFLLGKCKSLFYICVSHDYFVIIVTLRFLKHRKDEGQCSLGLRVMSKIKKHELFLLSTSITILANKFYGNLTITFRFYSLEY